jgi:capsular polysaccharide biosynthesis protein
VGRSGAVKRPTYSHRVSAVPDEERRLPRPHLAQGLRRWWWTVLLAAVIGGGTAYLVSRVIPPTYRATAQLFVAPSNPTVALQEVVLGQNLARSYVQLANAEVVLEPAMTRVGWTDLKTFRERTTISHVRDTFVITVSFDLDDPARAAAAANAIAETFAAQSGRLQSSLGGTVTIWQPATPPSEPESPRVLLNTILGAVLASLAAVVWLVLVPRVEVRVSEREGVRARLGTT